MPIDSLEVHEFVGGPFLDRDTAVTTFDYVKRTHPDLRLSECEVIAHPALAGHDLVAYYWYAFKVVD